MENSESALYLFCFARADAIREVQGTAVDGHGPVSMSSAALQICVPY